MKRNLLSAVVAVACSAVLCIAGNVARASSIFVGNPLTNYGATDGDPPLVILGEYTAGAPTATSAINFPGAGIVTAVQVWDSSAGQTFDAYILQPAGTDVNGNQQFKVIDSSGPLVTTAPGGGGVDTYTLSTPWAVTPGDLVAFWGKGPTYTTGSPHLDATYGTGPADNYDAVQPALGGTYSFGTFNNVSTPPVNYFDVPNGNDPRIYSIGVEFTATPEPSSIVALVGLCGMGLIGLIRYRRRASSRVAAIS
jgi:hypothetical protein